MALVDTQGFVMAVDRSLFGPQGRRWIERKLPEVATNMAFVVVSAFGACLLVFHICRDYHFRGYWGLLQVPKHLINAFMIHLVARALRWHIDRMLGWNMLSNDESVAGFFGPTDGGLGGRSSSGGGGGKGSVHWPWQSGMNSSIHAGEQTWSDSSGQDVSRSRHDQGTPSYSRVQNASTLAKATTSSIVSTPTSMGNGKPETAKQSETGGKSGHGFPNLFGACRTGEPSPTNARSKSESHNRVDGWREEDEVALAEVRRSKRPLERNKGASLSDDGGAGGNGAGSRGSRRRLSALTNNRSAEVVQELQRGDGRGNSGWSSLTKALGASRHKPKSQTRRKQKANFFTEDDLDELHHSTFFIKMCDDASWLYVEDQPYQPDMGWLLSLWGGYKIVPRYPGEVRQNEAHRMLFQCEKGRNPGNVRIRSRATNTFLFFLGVRRPMTWVAWDRDVVGGDWEDIKIIFVGKPTGPDGVLVGDERGRVILHSRPMNGYVSWNGSRFTHVPNTEGATVFMLQRMASSRSASRRRASQG